MSFKKYTKLIYGQILIKTCRKNFVLHYNDNYVYVLQYITSGCIIKITPCTLKLLAKFNKNHEKFGLTFSSYISKKEVLILKNINQH